MRQEELFEDAHPVVFCLGCLQLLAQVKGGCSPERAKGTARSFEYTSGMNGLTCMGSCIPKQERVIGSCCLRSMSRSSPLPCSSLHKRLVRGLSGRSSWCWIVLAGIAVRFSPFLMASTWCFSLPTPRSCSLRSAYGRSATKFLPIVALRRSTNFKRSKHNVV